LTHRGNTLDGQEEKVGLGGLKPANAQGVGWRSEGIRGDVFEFDHDGRIPGHFTMKREETRGWENAAAHPNSIISRARNRPREKISSSHIEEESLDDSGGWGRACG